MVAAGLKKVFPVAMTDTTRPIVYDDAMLVAGSLLLVDAGHSTVPAAGASGVPANSAAATNIAAALATAAGVSGSTNCTWLMGSNLSTAGTSYGKTERSAKGGLHSILTQSANSSILNNAAWYNALTLPNALFDWFIANPTHDFYFSVWRKVTRADVNASGHNFAGIHYSTTFPNPGLFAFYQAAYASADLTPSVALGSRKSGGTTGNPGFSNTAGHGWNLHGGANPAPTAGQYPAFVGGKAAMTWGPVSPFNPNSTYYESSIWYRTYIEDLTVSGRSYATVDALDFARYTADCLTAGGRYYGDTTPTAPSAIP